MLALRTLAVALSFALLAPHAHAQTIREGHPRLYMTPERLTELRALGGDDEDIDAMSRYVDRRIADPAGTDESLQSRYPDTVVVTAAFVAAVLQEDRYIDAAIDYLLTIAVIDPDQDWDTGTRVRLHAMSLAYDWLYEELSASQRTTVRNGIVAHVERCEGFVDEADFVSGHTRYGNVVILAAVLALYGDDTRLDDVRPRVIANFTDGYNRTLRAIGEGGGHHMGWMYGSSYSTVEPYLLWLSATGENWMPEFFRDVGYFHLYAANGEFEVPAFGDCWSLGMPEASIHQVATSSALGGNGYAESFFRELPVLWEPFRLVRTITRSSASEPAPLEELPLMRVFPGSGFVVSRDSWNRADATLLVFKSTNFYSYNHHHRDQNSFTVDYRGPLLLDAGHYDAYGSEHHRSFYTRTVAHDALLVHWDEEPIRPNHPRDGGQKIPLGWDEEPTTLEEIRGAAALEGLVAHSDNNACTWARGDASSAYHEGKLDSYVRDVLMVRAPSGRAHPAIFVSDRASLPEARASEIGWHFSENVRIEERRVHAQNPGGGHVRLDFLRPAAIEIESYSGARRWEVGGVSYPPTEEDGGVSPYWGRVSVAPSAPSRDLSFTTMIHVDGAAMDDLAAPADLGGDGWVGARSGDTIFAVVSGAPARLDLPAGEALVDGCIAGLPPSGSIEVAVEGRDPITVWANGDGLALFDPDAVGPPPPPPPPPGSYALSRARCALEIDGDAAELANAPSIEIEGTNGTRGVYRLAYDSDELYVTASIDDRDLSTAATERDGRLWEDDALELLVGDHKFFASASGVLGDARSGASSWDAEWRAEVRANGTLNDGSDEDSGFTVELSIPWAVLERSAPSPGEAIDLEIVLDDRSQDGASVQHPWRNPNGGDSTDRAGFGRMTVEDAQIDTCAPVDPGAGEGEPSGGCSASPRARGIGAAWLAAIIVLAFARRRQGTSLR